MCRRCLLWKAIKAASWKMAGKGQYSPKGNKLFEGWGGEPEQSWKMKRKASFWEEQKCPTSSARRGWEHPIWMLLGCERFTQVSPEHRSYSQARGCLDEADSSLRVYKSFPGLKTLRKGSGHGAQQGKAGSATACLCCKAQAWGQNAKLRQLWGERGGGREIQHHRNQGRE